MKHEKWMLIQPQIHNFFLGITCLSFSLVCDAKFYAVPPLSRVTSLWGDFMPSEIQTSIFSSKLRVLRLVKMHSYGLLNHARHEGTGNMYTVWWVALGREWRREMHTCRREGKKTGIENARKREMRWEKNGI